MSSVSAKVAVYVSNHGLGHFVRTGAVCARLAERLPVGYTVTTVAPPSLWPGSLAASTDWRRLAPDVGVIQTNGIDVDAAASKTAIVAWHEAFEVSVEKETAWLRAEGFDLVLADVPAVAFPAARRAGLFSVALANFSWDWIYRCMGFIDAAETAARAYAEADLLLELRPGPPMDAFRNRRSVGLLGRHVTAERHQLRSQLGLEPQQRLVLIGLPVKGGFVKLPCPTNDVFYLVPGNATSRRDMLAFPRGFTFADAMAAADAVVAKPGYGTIGDAAANGCSLLWTPRHGFPEDRFLEPWIRDHLVNVEVERECLQNGVWGKELERLLSYERKDAHEPPALQTVCDELAGVLNA